MTEEPRRRRARLSGPSMVDVAAVAGVSPITVSRVANGSPAVVEETRARVLAAMAQLGYRPNTAARALATGRFGTIGIIGFTLTTYGNTRTIAATANAAADKGYLVTLLTTAPREGDIRGAYARLREQAVDGVIVLADEELLDAHGYTFPPGVPVVLASGGASQYHGVDSDQFQGGRQATEFLLSLGHSTVSHVSGPTTFFSAVARRDGWRAALREAGVRPPRVLVGDWTSHSGYLHGQRLAADPKVTAVFVGNDQMAMGVMRAMHEAGRDVPGEVSVVGFDDMEDSDSFWPPLTTIRQRFDMVGRVCVDTLLREMRGEPVDGFGRHLVPTELVIRQSAAPPPRRRQ